MKCISFFSYDFVVWWARRTEFAFVGVEGPPANAYSNQLVMPADNADVMYLFTS